MNEIVSLLKTINIEEMEYKWGGETKVLLDAHYKGYRFIVASIGGHHPCAYIELKENHPLYRKDYEDEAFDNIPVHCGLTYSEGYLKLANITDSWIIGWDYAHIGDYVAMPDYLSIRNPFEDDKKWKVAEIVEQDVIPAIDWLEEVFG